MTYKHHHSTETLQTITAVHTGTQVIKNNCTNQALLLTFPDFLLTGFIISRHKFCVR